VALPVNKMVIIARWQQASAPHLIYRTEPTTKKWTTEELKSKKNGYAHCSVSLNSPVNPWSQSRRRKVRLRWEGFAEKEGFKPEIKE